VLIASPIRLPLGSSLPCLPPQRSSSRCDIIGTATTEADSNYGLAVETWLGRLERQLSASLPKVKKSRIPPLPDLYAWVDGLVLGAELITRADISVMNSVTHKAAIQNQAAILAALTTGRYLPPIRLSVARTLVHPSFLFNEESGIGEPNCQDRDCRASSCLGNHLEVFGVTPSDFETGGKKDLRRIKFFAPHHKTDRKGFAAIEFEIPSGPLTRMLLVHLDFGHTVITQSHGDGVMTLFNSRVGNSFSAQTYTHYWATIMKSASIPYFPPSLARTSFVDEYTQTYGEEPAMWEGAATIMGNTVKTWMEAYNPRKRGRDAQAAVDNHQHFTASLGYRGSEDDE